MVDTSYLDLSIVKMVLEEMDPNKDADRDQTVLLGSTLLIIHV